MNTLQTFKLWLEPDRDIPQFRRLRWAMEPVSIRDVLLQGIHPWGGQNQHYMMPEFVLDIINNDEAHLAELEQFHYCYNINVPSGYAWNKPNKFERTLQAVRDGLLFVDNLSYLELLDLAKEMLRQQWTHDVVRDMARSACPGFHELRQFLKNKDKRLKLSGYEDINHYDLAKVLTLEDFCQWDNLIINNAIPILNFRKASVLEKVTDAQGRLRLTTQIRHLTLTETGHATNDSVLAWCVSGEGNTWRFRPDIGESWEKRPRAEAFAKKWRTDNGKLCFTTSTDKLVEMVERKVVEPSFPTLYYGSNNQGSTATATVHGSQVQAFRIGPYPRQNATGEQLKDILRDYGVSMTGNKEQLLEKLAALAARKYHDRLPEMERFFAKNRFLRMRAAPKDMGELPLLDDLANLRNLILTMYAAKHLRGDTILEVSHENNTYTEEQLALALINGKTDILGAFLRVA